MAGPGMRELVSFDRLLTPRLASVVFWLGQLANLSIWGLIFRSSYKEYDYDDFAIMSEPPMTEGEVMPDYGMPEETIQWDNIWVCVVLFLLGIVLVRVLVDLALVQFRRLETERGILGALTVADAPVARPAVTAPAPAATPAPAPGPSPTEAPPGT